MVEIHSYDKPVSELHTQKMYRIEVKATTGFLSLSPPPLTYVCVYVIHPKVLSYVCYEVYRAIHSS